MKLSTKRFAGYISVEINQDVTSVDSGLLDQEERIELALNLISVADDLVDIPNINEILEEIEGRKDET